MTRTLGPEAPVLEQDGHRYRDLNNNGRLDPYEDARLPVEERVADLLAQMTVEEKVGLMFHQMTGMTPEGELVERRSLRHRTIVGTSKLVAELHVNHVNLYSVAPPRQLARWSNSLQKVAERTRLGIPVTVSSDPRHSCRQDTVASMASQHFSAWPEPIGLGAAADEELTREFGDMARREYVAAGIRTALHPMADLATEPRWSRIVGTFGEDAELSARMTRAYVLGFQGEELGPESVACMTKHFPGGGPQKDGEDPHFPYGKEQVYPGGNFEYHLRPFEAAFEAKTAAIMPYYGQPIGVEGIEEVGFGYNKDVVTGLLRERYGFDGVVCTDWGLVTPVRIFGVVTLFAARAWGVEHLSREERALKAIEAGVDQFGGEHCVDVVLKLVRAGRIGEARIDESARRLLRDKFRLGLFDDPYLDEDAAERTVGAQPFRDAGERAQRASIVLLKNGREGEAPLLPLKGRPKAYLERVDPEIAKAYCDPVATVEEADVAIVRVDAPFRKRRGILERLFHAGDLDFEERERARLLGILERVPTVLDVFLDRPAVLTEVAAAAGALVGNFGARDRAFLDVVFGIYTPRGKLPFELPSSMDAVRAQRSDVPYDSEEPLFPFGHGLSY
jgi:beta-glucosidase